MSELPSGTVTFLLTDIEDSTRLWEERPEAMRPAVKRHHEIVHKAIESFGGGRPEDQGEGDSVVGAFSRASDGVSCALELQRALQAEPWPDGAPIRVRVAIHTGEIELRDDRNYFGPTINRCARLRALAHGGQTLVSLATQELVRGSLPYGAYLKDLGPQRLKDLSHPEHVFQLCHPELPEDFPLLLSLEALPNNLPIQLTSLVGRDLEVLEVKKLLAESRLVTLIGAAGCGKTRLALQVAAELAEEYADGVWFADLAAITEPRLVPHTVAAALGVQEQPRREMIELLIDYLRRRRLLLLLDNCEHLLAACSALANTLLRSCPDLAMLATSREPLGVPGETSWRVPSLAIPDPDRPHALEELPLYESAQLFLERARAASSDFALDADEGAAVVQICHRLDGIPLAIELAAPLTAVLSCEQIAGRLGDMFRLLTGGSATALERQQTLGAAVEWSHQLLADAERALLRRLSVFVGGFTLEAAEGVGAGRPVESAEVLDLLSRLVHKSLVTREKRPHAARYRLLETIRQYARERLVESGEGPAVRALHRDWFLALAEEAEPEVLQGARQTEWIEILATEQDNLRAALEWSTSDASLEALARIGSALHRFWYLRGQGTEGRRWLRKAIEKSGEFDPALRAKILYAAGALAWEQHEHSEARKLLEEALEIRRALGDEADIAQTLNTIGNVHMMLSDYAGARTIYEESLEIRGRIGDRRGTAAILHNLSHVANALGELSKVRELLEKSLSIVREVGDRHGEAFSLSNLGRLSMNEGEYAVARPLFEQALSIGRELGARPIIGPSLYLLGILAFIQGDYQASRTSWVEAADNAREVEEVWGETIIRGIIAYLDGDFAAARALSMQAVAANRESGEKEFMVLSMTWAAYAAEAAGDYQGARTLWEEARSTAREIPGQANLSGPLLGLGRVVLKEGDSAEAEALFQEGLNKSRERKDPEGTAQGLEGLAGVAAATGANVRAAALLCAAHKIREQIGAVIYPHLRSDHEALIDRVREALGEGPFQAAWSRGEEMTLDEAVAHATGESQTE